MRDQSRVIPILALFFIVLSCKKEINIDIDQKEDLYVMNSIITNDSVMVVQLSKSISILSNNNEYPIIDNATVKAYDLNGQEFLFTHSSNGIYTSTQVCSANNSYTLKAQINSDLTLTANTTIPELVSLDEVDTSLVENLEYGYETNAFILKFKDKAGQDFYSVKILKESMNYIYDSAYYNIIDSVPYLEPLNIWVLEPSLTKDNQINFNQYTTFFDDQAFDGQNAKIIISSNENSMFNDKTYHIYFSHLSRDTYLYFKGLSNQNKTQGDPFAVPALMYDNIENGVGIFGGQATQTYTYVW